jgi:hypothetical protein
MFYYFTSSGVKALDILEWMLKAIKYILQLGMCSLHVKIIDK